MPIYKNRINIVFSFALVFGWVMSFPYEGPVLYALANGRGIDWVSLNSMTVFAHFIGLFFGRYISRNIIQAKKTIMLCIGVSIAISMFVPFVSIRLWKIMIPVVSALTGIAIVAHAHLIKAYVSSESRGMVAADLLIYGNVVLICAHIFANNTKPIVAFGFIEAVLIAAFLSAYGIDISEKVVRQYKPVKATKSDFRVYWILLLFIFVITINSGIMFQVIYPYFGQFELLTSIYTNIPYIVAIYLLSRRFRGNKHQFLYVGLALWGATFMLFALTGQTAMAFVTVCSVMLFACGIFDYFWWSVMASNFDNVKNAASLFGWGLSINVLGVWTGGLIGNRLISMGAGKQGLSYMGVVVVMVSMLIVLPLNKKLANLINDNEFLVRIQFVEEKRISGLLAEVEKALTRREFEVFNFLVAGKTNTEISQELFLSPHTVKTHNRNIYRKLNVANKMELIDKIS